MRRPDAKTLILDLLGTMRPGAAMPVAALVEAGALFGIAENAVRVALVRLRSRGRVARDERGRYRLGDAASAIGRRVRGWRDLAGRTRPWRGGWIGVLSGGPGPARRRGHALALFGFARLAPAVWIRPDNLAASLETVRDDLRGLGLRPADLVVRLEDVDPDTARRARALWDTARLRRDYRVALARLDASAARLPRLSDAEAMIESFVVGGETLRLLVRDPLLPPAICPPGERDRLLARMREYDRMGRAAWATLLRRHEVPCLRAPMGAPVTGPLAEATA